MKESVAVVGALLAGIALVGVQPAGLERVPYDLALRHAVTPSAPADEVTVVLVDDESLKRLDERWPLRRATWAEFLKKLKRSAPKVVALDAWFEAPAPRLHVELALDIADRLRDELDDAEEMADELEKDAARLDGDRQLAKTIAEVGPTVLGFACLDVACAKVGRSIPTLTVSATAQGALNVPPDPDGVIRRYAYSNPAGDSLALATARLLREAVSDPGEALLTPRPSRSFRTLRFSDVVEADGAGLAEAFGGRAVLVGVSALGTEDHVRTPVEGAIPGVYTHANALSDLLAAEHRRPAGPGGIAAGIMVLLLVAWRSRHVLVVGLVAAAAWGVAYVFMLQKGHVFPGLSVPIGIGAIVSVRLGFVYARGRTVRRAFQHYLAPAVVEQLVENPNLLQLGSTRREITAFFSDVKGFTSISEALTPDQLLQLLNECLGAMTDAIIAEGGTIDKYIGDAIVAMFGAPLDQPDHAARACRAAIRCQQVLDELRPRWREAGFPEIEVRIGLNSGSAVVGNMGSDTRFDYTMLGDTVNLAARLEGTNNVYGTWILCGARTAALAQGVDLRELDSVRVKGRAEPVRVFQVGAPPSEAYAGALEAYREGRFTDARDAFLSLAEQDDAPARAMGDRAAELAAHPPEGEWDGVFTMTTK